ncbi:hypothetical protein R84B8_01655 [Treponema sp. R8-4-B8]
MTKETKELFKKITEIVKKFEDLERKNHKTGMAYNVFELINIRGNEVILCRVIADLLNPEGHHYCKSIYLELFMDIVLKPVIKKTEKLDLSKSKIETNYITNKGRYIDIVINDGVVYIPIEIKIDAKKQPNQIADYAIFSREMNEKNNGVGFIPVLFLTPSWYPISEEAKDDYVHITYEEYIIPWLEKCLSLEETDKVPPVKEVLRQFINAIKSFCECEETIEKNISDLITEKRENYDEAKLMQESINELDSNTKEIAKLVIESVNIINFNVKAWEVFRDKIYNLVKKSILEVKCIDEGNNNPKGWNGIDIPLRHDYKLRLNYDLRSIAVMSVKSKEVDKGIVNKINKTMEDLLKVSNEFNNHDWEKDFIWVSESYKYLNINENSYFFELYWIYKEKPESVVKWILNIADAVKETLK